MHFVTLKPGVSLYNRFMDDFDYLGEKGGLFGCGMSELAAEVRSGGAGNYYYKHNSCVREVEVSLGREDG